MNLIYFPPAFPNFINQFQYNEIYNISKSENLLVATIAPWAGNAWDEDSKKLLSIKLFHGLRGLSIFFIKIFFNVIFNQNKHVNKFFVNTKLSFKNRLKLIYINALCDVYFDHLRLKSIDHIHADFATSPGFVSMILSKKLNSSFSVKVHAHDIYRNDLDKFHPYTYDIFKSADILFAEHAFAKKLLLSKYKDLDPKKIIVVRTGINIEKFKFRGIKSINSEKLKLISVGRLDPKKGHKFLIRACNLLKKNKIDFSCKIIGYGVLESSLNSLIEKLNLKNEVKIIPTLTPEKIYNKLKESHIYILPCTINPISGDMDGIPTSILEAMSVGLPVITTAISGIPEAIVHDKTGMIVNRDDYKSIYDAIIKLYTNQGIYRKIVRFANQRLNKMFESKTNTSNLLNSIKKIGRS